MKIKKFVAPGILIAVALLIILFYVKFINVPPKYGHLNGFAADLSDGEMIDHADITATDQYGEKYLFENMTIQEKGFSLELPPGRYKLHFSAEGYEDLDPPVTYTVEGDKTNTIPDPFTMIPSSVPEQKNGTLIGHVSDLSGEAIAADINITVTNQNGRRDTFLIDAGQEGFFHLDLPPGTYTLHFRAEGYEDLDSSRPYTVYDNESTEISELFLMTQTAPPPILNGRLSGYVANKSNEKKIARVSVTATDESGKEYTDYENSATSNKDGFFRLELPPGTYTLHFRAEDYNDLDTSASYTVNEDETTEITELFLMEQTVPPPPVNGRLKGYVADLSDGKMMSGVRVTATDQSGKEYTNSENTAISSSGGGFTLDLPPGTYKLHFKAEGYDDLDPSGSYTVNEDKDTDISGTFMMNKYVPPAPRNGRLSGYVVDKSDKKKLAGVDVSVTDQYGKKYTDYENTDTSNKDGFFRLELPPGTYTLHLKAAGYDDLDSSRSYTVSEDKDTNISGLFYMKKTAKAVSCRHSISSDDSEDYSRNLDPGDYYRYTSKEYPSFSFCYPPHLFNQTRCNYESYATTLGKNIENHAFFGNLGTKVTFSLSSRTDALSLKEAVDRLYRKESADIKEGKKKILSYEEHGFPGFVVTGYDGYGMIVYRLTRVYSDKVMELRIVCPPYKKNNDDDKYQKRYVIECIYRMCSFKNDKTSGPRSYSEYLRSDNK